MSRSVPARMSDQNPVASSEPGNSAETPTTAIGGLVVVVRRRVIDVLLFVKPISDRDAVGVSAVLWGGS